jgi:small subunit ribosomal protein S9
MEMINAIGRRKASVARVYLTQGSGAITVNGKEMKEYFPVLHTQYNLTDPMLTVGVEGTYDIKVNVNGGGFKGQAEAVRLAISRALVKIDEENRKPLKEKKYLMRDARVVERKKYGKPKARKSFQFSKR